MKEKDLKLRLNELSKYRKAGVTKVEECIEYERSLRICPPVAGGSPRKRNAGDAGLSTVDEEDDEVKFNVNL